MRRVILNIYRWIFARLLFQKFNKLIFLLSLRALGVLNYENSEVSGERYFINSILPQITKNTSPLFLDVGANVGHYSISLLETFPNAKIHVFEPQPHNFSALKVNISSPNVRFHNIAIGEKTDKVSLFDRADSENGSSHASLHEAVISEIHKQDILKYSVDIDTLDQVCKREKISGIDLLKIDTEGNELAVLRGALRLIEDKKVRCIHFEFNEMNIVSKSYFSDFRKTLTDYNFFRLLPNGLLPLDDSPILTELFAYQNIIALPKSTKVKL